MLINFSSSSSLVSLNPCSHVFISSPARDNRQSAHCDIISFMSRKGRRKLSTLEWKARGNFSLPSSSTAHFLSYFLSHFPSHFLFSFLDIFSTFNRKRRPHDESSARAEVELFNQGNLHAGVWSAGVPRRCLWKGLRWRLPADSQVVQSFDIFRKKLFYDVVRRFLIFSSRITWWTHRSQLLRRTTLISTMTATFWLIMTLWTSNRVQTARFHTSKLAIGIITR